MTDSKDRAQSVFLNAVEIPTHEERAAYLDAECGADLELRKEVDELLDHARRLGPFLEPIDAEVNGTVVHPISERPGTVIGPYKLLQQIGEGGMGVVFMAEQTRPVQRTVALKIIKPGMDTRQVIARFEVERQALAMMDHPNIAKVLDAGVVGSASRAEPGSLSDDAHEDPARLAGPTGRPYFVMDLVKGIPITDYCDQQHLTVRQRLELFTQVCHAVQHAHQKGIIHRDLKPSNVLVAEYDGKPVPKIIDFGVAKATAQRLTERTMFTQYGQIVGTFEYMSPEQARFNQLDVDTRSDIYSLGVLLYELLAGTTPFDRQRLETLAFDETLRIIHEEEPPKPSTRFSTSGSLPLAGRVREGVSASATIAANRNVELNQLRKLLRGELDWIVMKCLEKDRNRRYETANGVARDIERYLNDEAVQACPPSAWYRFRKFARRNMQALVLCGAAAVMLVALIGGLAASNIRVRSEQDRTLHEHRRAEAAQQLAEARAGKISQDLERLKAADALLDRGRWYVDRGDGMSVGRRRFDVAHAAFSRAIELRPDHVASWFERGDVYTALGLWDLAAGDFAREVELREPHRTLRWLQLVTLQRAVGDDQAAADAYRRLHERYFGTLNLVCAHDVLRARNLCPTAIPGIADDEARRVEAAQLLIGHEHVTLPLFILGATHYRVGQFEQAVRRLEETLASSTWEPRLMSQPVLAMAYHRSGRHADARKMLNEALATLDRWTEFRYAAADVAWPVPWWDWLEMSIWCAEARTLIDGAQTPPDPRLHILRARAFASLKWHDRTTAECAAALELRPDDPQIRFEAHRAKAFAFAVGQDKWQEAATQFAQATSLRPDDVRVWRFRAMANFAAADTAAYRETCAAMLMRFGDTKNRRTACEVVESCVWDDLAIGQIDRLLVLSEMAASDWHYGAWVRCAALYRAGRYRDAALAFESMARTFSPRASDWCFLAMAQHYLGHPEDAQRSLNEASRWISEANRHEEDDLTGTRPAWEDWYERPVVQRLFKEAEELLKERPKLVSESS